MPETTEAIVAYTLLPLRDPSLLQCPLGCRHSGVRAFGRLARTARGVAAAAVANHPPRALLRASITGGPYVTLTFTDALSPSTVFGPLSGLVLLAAFVAVPLTESRGLSGLVRGAQMVDSHENARRRVAGTAAQAD